MATAWSSYVRVGQLSVLALLSGCTSLAGYPTRPESPQRLQTRSDAFYGPGADAAYTAETDPAKRRAERDRLVYGRIQVLTDRFQDLERAVAGSGVGLAVGSDLVVLALNGLGATTGGSATKAALSAASGGVVGAQGAISKDLYYQRTLPAVIAQMQAGFAKQRAAILTKLSEQSDADYPLGAAAIDLQQLEDSGSLMSAVGQITQQAESTKQRADEQVDALRALTLSHSASADLIGDWLLADGGSHLVERTAALQAWLAAQDEPALHQIPPAQIRGDYVTVGKAVIDLEPVRQRAINDKGLNIHR